MPPTFDVGVAYPGIFTDQSKGIFRIYLKWITENRKMPTCNRLDLETLRASPLMDKVELQNIGTKQSFITIRCAVGGKCPTHKLSV